ncbi:hypothetical protein C8R43DRAFT_953295 [Mycena crocata]|nr:hypothetical protein C8R43DRAFT_953295 [Mycena crocata]
MLLFTGGDSESKSRPRLRQGKTKARQGETGSNADADRRKTRANDGYGYSGIAAFLDDSDSEERSGGESGKANQYLPIAAQEFQQEEHPRDYVDETKRMRSDSSAHRIQQEDTRITSIAHSIEFLLHSPSKLVILSSVAPLNDHDDGDDQEQLEIAWRSVSASAPRDAPPAAITIADGGDTIRARGGAGAISVTVGLTSCEGRGEENGRSGGLDRPPRKERTRLEPYGVLQVLAIGGTSAKAWKIAAGRDDRLDERARSATDANEGRETRDRSGVNAHRVYRVPSLCAASLGCYRHRMNGPSAGQRDIEIRSRK